MYTHKEPQLSSKNRSSVLQPRKNKTGLPDQLKSGMESLSGMSLDHVRVHYNSPKPAAVQAHAYAQGSDIHLAPGQAKHLPHELGHVVQQAQGRVKPTTSVNGVAVNDNPSLEKEADRMGARALQMVVASGQHGFGFVDNRAKVVSDLNSYGTKIVIQQKKVLNIASGTNEDNLLKSTDTEKTTVTNVESGHMMVASVFDLIKPEDLVEVFKKLGINGNNIPTQINNFLKPINDKNQMKNNLILVDNIIKEIGYNFSLTEAFLAETHYLQNPDEVKPKGSEVSTYGKARKNRSFKLATFDEELADKNKYDQLISISPFGFKFFENIPALLNKLEDKGEVIISASAKNPIWREIFGSIEGKEIQNAIEETTERYQTYEQEFYERTTKEIIHIYFEDYNSGPLKSYFDLIDVDVKLPDKLNFGDHIKSGSSKHTVNTDFDIEYFAKVVLSKK